MRQAGALNIRVLPPRSIGIDGAAKPVARLLAYLFCTITFFIPSLLSAQPLPHAYHAANRALSRGDTTAAHAILRQLIDAQSPLPAAYERLAEIYIDSNRLLDGIREFQKILRARPGDANAHAALAILHNSTGNADSALAHGLYAVRHGAPIIAACEIAVHLTRLQSKDALLNAHIQARLAEVPGDLTAGYTRAYIAYADGHLAEARSQLQALEKKYPREWRLYHLRAEIEIISEPADRVFRTIQQGMAAARSNADSSGMARLLYQQFNAMTVTTDMSQAKQVLAGLERLRRISGYVEALVNLANAQWQNWLGEKSKAIESAKNVRQWARQRHDFIFEIRATHIVYRLNYSSANLKGAEDAVVHAKSMADAARFSPLQLLEEITLGLIRELLGQYHLTSRHLASALAETQRMGALHHLLYVYSGMGRQYLRQAEEDSALMIRYEQVKLSQALGRWGMAIDAWGEIARLCLRKGKLDSASVAINSALKLMQRSGEQRDASNINLLCGDVERARRNYAKAEYYYQQSFALSKSVGSYSVGMSLIKLGDLYLHLGDCDRAREAYRSAYEEILRRVIEQGLQKGQLDLGTSSEAILSYAKSLVHCGKSLEGFHKAAQSRLFFLRSLEVERQRILRSETAYLSARLDSLRNELANIADSRRANDERRLNLMNQIEIVSLQMENLGANNSSRNEAISDSLWILRLHESNNDTLLTSLQKSLKTQQAIALFYLTGANVTMVFALHPDTLIAQIVPGVNRDTLRAMIRNINPLLVFDKNRLRSETIANKLQFHINHQAASVFNKKMIAPFLLERKYEKLIVLPDDILCALPFDAILAEVQKDPARSNARNALEVAVIQIAVRLGDIIPQPPADSVRTLLMANGEPVISSATGDTLPALRHALDEVEKIASVLPYGTAHIFRNAEASKDTFLLRAGGFGVLHLAMHARVSEWSPEYSCLFFGGDKPLYGFEISLQQFNARLVTLSACNTGLGQFRRGVGLLSFVQSFFEAKTPSVVASLWRVEEKATNVLMVEFYRQVGQGKKLSTSLALAKQHLIDSGYEDPYYWAGFALYGKDGTIGFLASPPPSRWYILILVAAVSLFIFSLWKRRARRNFSQNFANRA